MKKPIIGITLDSEKKKTYSKFPWYALRENYLTSLTKFNAIPFPLLHEKKYIEIRKPNKCRALNWNLEN